MTNAMTQQRKRATYTAYKPSGLMWLEDVPSMWPISRLRFQVKINPVKSEIRGIPQDTSVSFVPMEAVGEYGGLRLEQTHALEDVANGYTYFRDGDVVVAKITPCFENGKGSIAEGLENGIGFGTTELHVLRPSSFMDRNYLFYLTISHAFRKIGASYLYGAGGQKRVPDTFIRDFRHPIPTTNEQRSIAAFLDRETVRIDALIEKKRCQIELLQEKRSSLISHAVTKGLNSSAPMKESGFEWLGKIPAHWQVLPIKRVARMESGHTPDKKVEEYWTDCKIPWVSLNDTAYLKEHDYIEDTAFHVNELGLANSSAHLLPARVVLFTRDATIGLSAITKWPMAVSQHIIAWICGSRIIPEYLLRVFYSMTQELERLCMGSTIRTLGMPDVLELVTPLPPVEEQQRIVDHLVTEVPKLVALEGKVEESIRLLIEHRAALISAAVTGKIDVRDSIEQRPKQFKRG